MLLLQPFWLKICILCTICNRAILLSGIQGRCHMIYYGGPLPSTTTSASRRWRHANANFFFISPSFFFFLGGVQIFLCGGGQNATQRKKQPRKKCFLYLWGFVFVLPLKNIQKCQSGNNLFLVVSLSLVFITDR